MKKNKIFLVLVSCFALTACQSVKDGLSGSKSENSDEFLVQKKNPLVKPENFDELPQPSEKTKDGNSKVDDEDNIEDLFQIDTKEVSATSTTMSPLEKSILKKINEN